MRGVAPNAPHTIDLSHVPGELHPRHHPNISMTSRYLDIPIPQAHPDNPIQEQLCHVTPHCLRTPADIGLAIQQARLGRELSQDQLADETSLRQSAISEIENGKSTIHLRRILELARATGIEITASWGEDDSDAPRR